MNSLRISKLITLVFLGVVMAGTGYGAFWYYRHLCNQAQSQFESQQKQISETILQRLEVSSKQSLETILASATQLVPPSTERMAKGLKLLEELHPEIHRAFYIDQETILLPGWKKLRRAKKLNNVMLGIAENPDFKLAELLEYQQQNFKQAVAIYEKFWLQNPDDFQATNALARCLFKLGAYDRSEKIYRQIFKQNPPTELQDEIPLALTAAFQLFSIYQLQGKPAKLKNLAVQIFTDLGDEKWELTKSRSDFLKRKILTTLEPFRRDHNFRNIYYDLLARDRSLEQDKNYVHFLSIRVIPFIESNRTAGYQVYFLPGGNRFLLIAPHGEGHLVLEADYPEFIQKYLVASAQTLSQDYTCAIVLSAAGRSWKTGTWSSQGRRAAAALNPIFPDLRAELSLPSPSEPWTAQRELRLRKLFLGGYAIFCLLVFLVGTVLWKQMQLAALKSDFVSHVSHELKTPLTALRMFSEMLLFKPQLPVGKQQQYFNIMNEESIRLSRLIENLLDVSRIERRKSQFTFRAENLDAVIRDALDVFVSSLEQPIPVQPTLAADAEIWVDRDALIQVMLNLLDNARKYSPAGSAIEVRSGLDERRAYIFVQDHGVGISPRELRRVFGKFYQVRKSYEEKFKGVGLGLAIVRNIIRHHRGRITLQSEKGQGTTAMIALPRKNNRRK